MPTTDPCTVCQLENQSTANAGQNIFRTQCARCGIYDWRIGAPLQGRAKRQVLMSGFIRAQNNNGIIPLFTPELVAQVEQFKIPSLRDRCELLLDVLVKIKGYSQDPTMAFDSPEVLARTYSDSPWGLVPLVEILQEQGLAIRNGDGVALTPKGYLEVDGRNAKQTTSHQGFVAMSFDKALDEAFSEGFSKAIVDAGYRPFRIDTKEHANGISDEIMAEIRRSRFVVADYTLMNNGVYFEAGFAIGSGIPVIPTCRETHFDKLHFDIRHINTLRWAQSADLRSSLSKRIEAVIGLGPYAKPA
jgi:nucleoside 2-deoxyribosyltransferase